MSNFARIDGDTVVEVVTLPDGLGPADFFAPELAETFIPCPEDVEDHWSYVDGAFIPPVEPPETDLAFIKSSLKTLVDVAAETERLKYITPGAGQALTYMQKSDEARRYLSEDNPDAADYPLLSAEVGITANDMAGVASTVAGAFTQWQQIGAAIEATRLGAKAAIEASGSAEDAQTAYCHIQWPNL